MFKEVSQCDFPRTEWHAETLWVQIRSVAQIQSPGFLKMPGTFGLQNFLQFDTSSARQKPQCHLDPAGVERVPWTSQQTLSHESTQGQTGISAQLPSKEPSPLDGAVHFMPWGKQVELSNNYTLSNFNACEQTQKDEKIPTPLDELNV